MDICTVTKNKHLLWFRRILDAHFEGIIAHATFNISAGRIEGINNKIKTLRRKGYGYPDDDYFFLKLFDVSRKPYIRNPSSHNFYDWPEFFAKRRLKSVFSLPTTWRVFFKKAVAGSADKKL